MFQKQDILPSFEKPQNSEQSRRQAGALGYSEEGGARIGRQA